MRPSFFVRNRSILELTGYICQPCLFVLISLFLFGATQVQAEELVEYGLQFQGVQDRHVLSDLQDVSNTYQLKDYPPASRALLQKRARKDVPLFEKILQAYSYYHSQIQIKIEDSQPKKTVVFHVSKGPQYSLHMVNIATYPPVSQTSWVPPSVADLGLELDQPALAKNMSQAFNRLVQMLNNQGYVFAQVDKPVIVVDHERHWVDLQFRVHLGPKARFGHVSIQGLQTLQSEYVQDKITWKRGDMYEPKLVRDLKERLIQSELFSMVNIEHAQELTNDGSLPLTITVHERPHHQVSAGLRYDTDIGVGMRISWEDQNLLGRAESLYVHSQVSQNLQEIKTQYSMPQFVIPDQAFHIQGLFKREDTDAYTSRSAKLELGLDRALSESLHAGAGFSYSISQLTNEESDHFHLLSWPLFLDWDTRDDVLNPRHGGQIQVYMTPFTEVLSKNLFFTKSSIAGKWFLPILGASDLIWAFRTYVGTIFGASNTEIPADERFYCGGGGSVRGYPYQEIGPYQDGDPFGGRSLIELSNEIRWQWSPRFGTTVFLDGGNAYSHIIFDLTEKLYWGAGLGLRYYTSIAPLRIDIAFPLNEDRDMDIDPFQVYISIGQSF